MNLSLESVKTSQELIHRGISSSQIRRARDAGGYTQLVRGCYCLTSEWMAWSQREKKLAQIVAHLKTHPDHVPSHHSAALVWDAPLLSLPEHIWVSAPSAHVRSRSSAIKIAADRTAICQQANLHQGIYVTSPAQTAVDCARTLPTLDALCIADFMLHTKLCSRAELETRLHSVVGRGAARARIISDRMSGLAASAAESIARNHLITWRFPLPSEQTELYVNGHLYRPDFLWESQRLILEVDGDIKYSGTYGDPLEVIQREHRRQRDLEQLGYQVLRVRWDDITRNPEHFRNLLLRYGLRPHT